MLDYLIRYQKIAMIFLEGICEFIAFFILITRNIGKQRKIAIFLLEVSASFLLGATFFFLSYNGVSGKHAWYMVRISKFLDYFSSNCMIFAMNIYLKDLFAKEGGCEKKHAALIVTDFLLLAVIVLLIISQFNGFYYTFDDNTYHRGSGRIFATLLPACAIILQILSIIPYHKKLPKKIRISIVAFLVTPIIAAVLQLFMQGVYITNISIVGMAVILYVFVIYELNESVERAHKREVEILENYQKELEQTVEKRTHELRIANEKADRLLLNILPESVAEKLKDNPEKTISQNYPNATILFTDIVGFTKMSSEMSAEETVALLNDLVSLFDKRAETEGIEKIKTIGDAYMAAAGLSENKDNDGAKKLITFAKGLLEDVANFNRRSSVKIQIRVGINSGNLVAGVIGKTKFIYDVWGDTVNVASRMESTGEPMKIHVSEVTYNQTKNYFPFEGPVLVDVKGKGLMNGYFI